MPSKAIRSQKSKQCPALDIPQILFMRVREMSKREAYEPMRFSTSFSPSPLMD